MKLLRIFVFLFIICFPGIILAKAEWTVLVYLAADNSLSQAAFDDINEMESVTYNDSVKVIVQIDPNEDLNYPPYFTTARRYFITHDDNPDSIGSILLDDLGEINSADPDEVSDFANWGFNKYPSKKRMLILWDHGNGWSKDDGITKYICYDNNEKISVAEGELNQAISNIIQHLDILVFDACLMQMPEVIGEVYEYCDFVIGSEEVVPEDGLPYGDITYHQDGIFDYLVENSTSTPEEFSNEIVTRYINSYSGGSQGYNDNISLSAVNTEYFPEFQNKLFLFTNEYSDTLYNYIYENIHSNCQNFNSSIDVYQFFYHLKIYTEFQEVADEIISIIDSMVVNSIAIYNGQFISKLGKMSVYFPQFSTGLSNWKKYYQLSFVQETRWDRFLDFYFNKDNEPPEIIDFSISAQGNLVYFSWDAKDPSFINYKLQYRTLDDTTTISILDSTSQQSYQLSFPVDNYIFNLTAEDEFGNKSYSSKTIFLSKEKIFKFFPNPYLVSNAEKGKFIFSTGNSGKAEIFIYNFARELVERLETVCNEYDTCEMSLPFSDLNLSSGIYFCLLKTGNRTDVLKLAIIR